MGRLKSPEAIGEQLKSWRLGYEAGHSVCVMEDLKNVGLLAVEEAKTRSS